MLSLALLVCRLERRLIDGVYLHVSSGTLFPLRFAFQVQVLSTVREAYVRISTGPEIIMLYLVTLIRLGGDAFNENGVAVVLTSDLNADAIASVVPQGWLIAFRDPKFVMEIITSSGFKGTDLETLFSWGFNKLLSRSPGNSLYLGAHALSSEFLTKLGYRGPA